MSSCVVLRTMEKTVRFYGQNTSPIRVRGVFDCCIGGVDFRGLAIYEGHVNSGGPPVRVISIACPREYWELDELAAACIGRSIDFASGDIAFTFGIERIRSSVIGKGEFEGAGELFRGVAKAEGEPADRFRVYEPTITAERQVYIEGSRQALRRLAEKVNFAGVPTRLGLEATSAE